MVLDGATDVEAFACREVAEGVTDVKALACREAVALSQDLLLGF
jgi:hypothetical protein